MLSGGLMRCSRFRCRSQQKHRARGDETINHFPSLLFIIKDSPTDLLECQNIRLLLSRRRAACLSLAVRFNAGRQHVGTRRVSARLIVRCRSSVADATLATLAAHLPR